MYVFVRPVLTLNLTEKWNFISRRTWNWSRQQVSSFAFYRLRIDVIIIKVTINSNKQTRGYIYKLTAISQYHLDQTHGDYSALDVSDA